MTSDDDKATTPPAGGQSPAIQTPAEEIKRLFSDTGTGTDDLYRRSSEGSSATKPNQVTINVSEGSRTKPVKDLAEDLPSLPPNLHPFRDPNHKDLVKELRRCRILVLTSYQESAAYAAGYSLVTDDIFRGPNKKALFPTRGRDKDRADLDLLALTDEDFLEQPQILLIEVDSHCAILDSAQTLPSSVVGRIRDRLETTHSYIVLAINEDLFVKNTVAGRVPCHSVSHLRYLLTSAVDDPAAEELERRLLTAVEHGSGAMELRELYQRVDDRLSHGIQALEDFLTELEQARTRPLAERKQLFQPVTARDVFRADSEVHRAAAFVATYFPEIAQRDFDCLVLALLGDQTTTVERVRQVIGRDGSVTTIREEVAQRWSERWEHDGDQVFEDCHLRPVVAADGSWVVDFSEPYLRRELRAHLERHFSWYFRRQCQVLQDCGIFFELDLSPAAVDALVRLFVERAVVDPAGFGSVWLLDLVGSLKIQLKGEPPSDPPEAALVWLLEKLAVEAQLRAHFYGRLAVLIREMLDREALRPMVREFFEFLITSGYHDALLDVVLELARRLRFAPHFDPLFWMRRLLDQGNESMRQRTVGRLIALARDSGPRIYEFLAAIRGWLPEAGRPPARFSVSNRIALEFPFAYCLNVARWLPDRQLGAWPSRHPLFYALPALETEEARREIAGLVEWILDPRGAALETGDKSDPTRPAEAVRVGLVADLVEHWSWVLDRGADSAPEGHALFQVILEEIDRQIGARERAWLQRSWRRRQDECLAQVTSAGGATRTILGQRRARLDQLNRRLAELAAQRQAATHPSAKARGSL
jgi:hypothetical protein